MARVHAKFDCGHEVDLEVQIEDDVIVPDSVRGLGQCSSCMGEESVIPVAGVAPQPGGARVVLDSILMIPI